MAPASKTREFPEDLLERHSGHLLVTGPAGYGKTTFCRWHALDDATRLVEKKAAVLPVYVPLHPLSQGELDSATTSFFRPTELRSLLQQQAAGQSPFEKVRLYLDGLDEVTSTNRQSEIMALAKQCVEDMPFVQVIVTAREHVVGPGLRWLPRVRLAELDDAKTRELATKWLDEDAVDSFFAKLHKTSGLKGLMGVPLLGTLILAVFKKTKALPPNKTDLYTLFTELLCGGWDIYKSLQRGAQFGVQVKLTVLMRLAGILHMSKSRDASDSDFKVAVKTTLKGLVGDVDQMLDEILSDGLLARIGIDLTFSHLSFQEYLAALDLRDPTGVRPKQAIGWYFGGQEWWREVVAFYVTLSGRPVEMDEWIVSRALASSTHVVDLEARVKYLREALRTAFPAYESHVPLDWEERLTMKQDKLAAVGRGAEA